MLKHNDFVIDFERVNQLTSHKHDNPTEGVNGSYCYSINRKVITQLIEIYMSHKFFGYQKKGSTVYTPEKEYLEAVEILHYNRVLISNADLRDKKLDSLLEQYEDDEVDDGADYSLTGDSHSEYQTKYPKNYNNTYGSKKKCNPF